MFSMPKAVSKSGSKSRRKEWTKRVQPLRSCLLVFAGILLMHYLQNLHLKRNGFVPSTPPTNAMAELTPGKPAMPWGELSCQRITLERPDEFVSDEGYASSKPAWVFAGYSRDDFAAFLPQCELSREQLQTLTDPHLAETDAHGTMIFPPVELVRALSPVSRQKIYSVLAQFPQNFEQAHPFSFPVGESESWLQQTGLSAQTLDAVNKLLYRQGNSVCFCDLAALQGISTDAERQRLTAEAARATAQAQQARAETERQRALAQAEQQGADQQRRRAAYEYEEEEPRPQWIPPRPANAYRPYDPRYDR